MGKAIETPVNVGTINIVGSLVYNEVPQATGGKRVAIDASGISDI